MGPAPHATGWFGRGKAGSSDSEFYESQNAKLLTRKARQQIDRIDTNQYQMPEGANEYNIWYGRYMGEHWKRDSGAEPAQFRCKVVKDGGWTKADKSSDKKIAFCIYFARGVCARGHQCSFYHRVPLPKDDAELEPMYDVFGRERHRTHRDDMGGVGSFESNCRTLYVGGLRKKDGVDLEKVCWKHFSEWGEVEHINVVYRLSIAFVRYRLRASAEFAKLAMQNQALDNKECLNLRWAYDDPNPVAKAAIERADNDAIYGALKAQGHSLEAAPFDYPANYTLPPPNKRSRTEGSALAYPDTDAQYQPHTKAQAEAAQEAQKVQSNLDTMAALLNRIDSGGAHAGTKRKLSQPTVAMPPTSLP